MLVIKRKAGKKRKWREGDINITALLLNVIIILIVLKLFHMSTKTIISLFKR